MPRRLCCRPGWTRAALPACIRHHLIFSVWALTQHYADFDMQVRAVLGPGHDPFAEAGDYLETMFRKLLKA
jgi:TetR/AcrR family transcriptional regulator